MFSHQVETIEGRLTVGVRIRETDASEEFLVQALRGAFQNVSVPKALRDCALRLRAHHDPQVAAEAQHVVSLALYLEALDDLGFNRLRPEEHRDGYEIVFIIRTDLSPDLADDKSHKVVGR